MNPLDTTPGRMRSIAGCMADLNAANERMIAVQMLAYPSGWPEADKRELAEKHLGRAS